jgi:hypothetical protein
MNLSSSSIILVLGLSLVAVGCDKSSSTAQGSTDTASTTNSAPAAKAATAEGKPAAQPASAAASFPATALPAKQLAGYTIALPTGGKLEADGDDRARLETPDYRLIIKPAKANQTAEMKAMMPKMPGFKEITVDSPDGLVVQVEEKGATQFVLTRYVKLGDAFYACDNALTKPPKDKAKAQEAFDVCGTLKKK